MTTTELKPQEAAAQTVLPDTASGLLAQILDATAPENLAPRARNNQRKEALDFATRVLEALEADSLRQAEEALKDRPDLANRLAVHHFFDNAPAGSSLFLHATANPAEAVEPVIQDLAERDFKFQTLGVIQNWTPEVADQVGTVLARHAEKGVLAQVFGHLEMRGYDELVKRLVEAPLLGSQPGRDQQAVFAGRGYSPKDDPHQVCPFSFVGGALGKRYTLDLRHGLGEAMAGNRNDGDGSKGALSGGAPLVRLLDEQRNTLACHAINTVRDWRGVGTSVVAANRSLQEGKDSRWRWISTSRLRMMVQSVFHATAEHELQFEPRRTKGRLEKILGKMKALLEALVEQGWLAAADVAVDYESMVVKIAVKIVPAEPMDVICLEYTDEH